MSGWDFKREIPSADGAGSFWTDGRLAENFLAGIQLGVESRDGFARHEGMHGTCEGFVYFMGIGDPYVTHVKVGFTNGNPSARMKSLQTGCPFPIRLLGFVLGNRGQEAELHRVLEEYRATGEWFVFSEYVEAVVRNQLEAEMFA